MYNTGLLLLTLPPISLFNQKNMSSDNRESLDETFLGIDASFKGELSFGGTLCIDGKFEGQINTSGTLIISKTGEIKADIQAETVICEGLVQGDITASKRVELRPNSNIIGNIQSPSLNIEVGAKLDGKCDMSHKK